MKLSKKQIIAIILLIILVLATMTGCGNEGIFDNEYDKAICKIGNEVKEINLKSWTISNGEQLKLKDNEGNIYLVSSFNCTLIKENK